MGRAPCCDKANVKKGPWSPEEDAKLLEFMDKYGTGGNWIALPQKAGLKRCGKSCRLRWLNYLRPNIKHGEFSYDEDRIICTLYANIGSRWSIIAAQLPGRTDNDIKNYWNTKLKKKLMNMAMAPSTQYEIIPPQLPPSLLHQSPLSLSSCYTQTEPSIPQINLYNSSSLPTNYNSLLQNPNYPSFKDGLHNFGVGEQSCSSSNGSSSCNVQIKQEEQMGFYWPNGLEDQNYQSMVSGNSGSGILDQISINPSILEYDLEEIKQIINDNSTNIGGSNISSSSYVERDMYCNYYY
ncbi:hypothetical protein LguiA_012301 [Lonicera macranthoides]